MMRITILDRDWKIYLLEADKFIRRFGDSDAAVTLPGLSEIYFSDEELDLINVKHELWHAYYACLCTNSASLSLDQQEEIFCELGAVHGDKLNRNARFIFKELKNGETD